MNETIIKISNLKKSYGEIKAVDGISFEVKRGSLFAFLGVNGAGKSTTINILCTLLDKDEGDVEILGYNFDCDEKKIREMVGVVFQGSILDKTLSVKDNLTIRASFYGLSGEMWKKRLKELTEILDLNDILKRKYGKLSGGQRRRIDIARALINHPSILILDEPTTGLDPQTRKTVWNIIEKLRVEHQVTVFLTTHYMEESSVADKVVIIDAGKIVASGSPIELKNKYSSDKLFIYGRETNKLNDALSNYKYLYEDNKYKVYVSGGEEVKTILSKNASLITDFEVIKGDMDDVFLNVTGKKLSGGQEVL